MIYLITAVPGSGKSLYTLDWLRKKSDAECRQVYYHNIPLSEEGKNILQWIELPDPREWFKLPAGAIIVIDECQYPFPVRKSGNDAPEYISKFATHRHLGLDVVLITQHPSLMDSFIRRLVGTHVHLVRQFGAERSTVLTWQEGVQENPNSKSAQKSCLDRKTFVFPKQVYRWYKSAEVHTHKFQMPRALKKMIFMLILAFFAIGFLLYYMYHSMYLKPKEEIDSRAHASSQPAQSVLNPAPSANGKIVKTSATFLNDRQPRVQGMPDSAPAYDDLTTPKTFPKVTACIATKTRCSCFTQQATPIEMEDYRCRYYVDKGWFDPYIDPQEQRDREMMARRYDSSAPVAVSDRGPFYYEMGASNNKPNLFDKMRPNSSQPKLTTKDVTK